MSLHGYQTLANGSVIQTKKQTKTSCALLLLSDWRRKRNVQVFLKRHIFRRLHVTQLGTNATALVRTWWRKF